ncbi:MAG: hypothetical protein AB7S78_07480 [Candidatus Omnitrophota bacterium]
MVNETQNKYSIGLDSWIIQDGNYDNFEAGKDYFFAVEFYSKSIQKSEKRGAVCTHLFSGLHRIEAEVVFTGPECWIIDIGFLAYSKAGNKDGFKAGDRVGMEAYLGIDPFYYFEELQAVKDIPAMIYHWHLGQILLDTTPWITKKNKRGEAVRIRNVSESSSKQIGRTNAWDDDDGSAAYILEVNLLPDEPKRRR